MSTFIDLPRRAATRLVVVLWLAGVVMSPEPAHAQTATTTLDAVTVSSVASRQPVEKSYDRILQGQALFARLKARHAPDAELRYRLLPRRPDTGLQSVEMFILGRDVEQRVAVAADHTFRIDPLPADRAAGAQVTVLDREALTVTWRTDVRSPGVPQGMRRLGDLRVECEVGLESGLVSNVRSILDEISQALTRPGFCLRNPARYYFFAERPLFKVTLAHGTRRHVLPADELYAGLTRDPRVVEELAYCDCEVLLDRTYFLPLGDASWPDDALVSFDYMDPEGPQ